MYNFFANKVNVSGDVVTLTGNDYNHIKNVLRLKSGDRFSVSVDGENNLCELMSFTDNTVICKIVEKNFLDTSLPIKIALFQGLPKSDKLELIIQKTVELGVEEIIPVEMKRCVVKIENNKKKSKTERWNAISESAAKQCKRAIIPNVREPLSFNNALSLAKEYTHVLVPYECHNGMTATKEALSEIKPGDSVAIFIGPEGGFDDNEIALLTETRAKTISLGKRILRTETASITAVSMLMLYAEINL